MNRDRILLVEDDENLRVGLRDVLVDEGYEVVEVSTCAAARTETPKGAFGLLILDIMLPDGDGYRLCRELRQQGYDGMVLMLTARSLEEDIVRGFAVGADDYLPKPYRLRELLARVAALFRRQGRRQSPVSTFGDFEIDREARHVVRENGDRVSLTRTEFDLLCYLVDNRDRALTRKEILKNVWPQEVIVDDRTVDNFVSSLKKKLGWSQEAGYQIQTVRGVGYRMVMTI